MLLVAGGAAAWFLTSGRSLDSLFPARTETPPAETAEPSGDHNPQLLVEAQSRLLEEQKQSVRQQALKLHAERIALRQERMDRLAEEWTLNGKRQYDRLVLVNRCRAEISVAVYYMDLDEKWITRGWWAVKPGDSVTTNAMTRNAFVYFYAENLPAGIVIDGQGLEGALDLRVVEERFDQLDGEELLYANPRTLPFYQRKTASDWTDHEEVFECFLEAPPSRTPKPLPAEAPP